MQPLNGLSQFPSFSMSMSPNGQRLMLAAGHMQVQLLKAAIGYQIETLSFLRRRYEQDVKLVDDLASSDGLNDAFGVVNGFIENAVAEYAGEAGRMATIGSKFASETAGRVRREAKGTVEDFAAATVA